MYLRISTIVEGKVDEYYSPEKIDAVANEDLDDLKVELEPLPKENEEDSTKT